MLKKLIFTSLALCSFFLIEMLPAKAGNCRSIMEYGSPSNTCTFPSGGGVFQNKEWEVAILHYEEEYYIYKGRNRLTGDSLRLDISAISGTTERSKYIFRNGNYKYVVTIQPSDPNVIRLEVSQGQRVLLNQLLYRTGNSGAAHDRIF